MSTSVAGRILDAPDSFHGLGDLRSHATALGPAKGQSRLRVPVSSGFGTGVFPAPQSPSEATRGPELARRRSHLCGVTQWWGAWIQPKTAQERLG